MGEVSGDADALEEKISNEYECSPQNITVEGGIGFNVGGQEVGRVMDMDDGGLDVKYYAPGSERFLPVFGEGLR